MPVLTQTDERTVRGEGYSVTIADEHTVRYTEPGRSLNFEISLQCCGGIQFVMHTLPPPDRWDRASGEERITIDEDEYQMVIKRTKQALEYLQLQFVVD
jgi:hypothetical protein